jgi:UDP-N-acetylglucosamine 2-epimerase (non-hydrolysing)
MGTNILVGRNTARLAEELDRILSEPRKTTKIPPLWDGHAADRIAKVIIGEPWE